ncbi:hypothetical protein ACF08N_16890 [Streptomyces sp. NPDC015127]|uniref:hypothetical protein n=1 Tax=Streptomyces sp. NPDC015127 TaxID=3364939 RepID=UPI0036F612B1
MVAVRRNLLRTRLSLAAYQHLRTAARTAATWEGIQRADALKVLKAAADGYADQRQDRRSPLPTAHRG